MTQPETLPLAKCPNPACGNECRIDSWPGAFQFQTWWQSECSKCGYHGPKTDMAYFKAVELHNALCSPDKPEAEAVCKLCNGKGRYSVDKYDKDAQAWMPEWVKCECQQDHQPLPSDKPGKSDD